MNELYILGSKINDVSLNEAMEKIANFLLSEKNGYIVTPNPEICLISYKDKNFRRIIQNSFLSIPDGSGLKIGARILGDRLHNKTTGADLSQKILELAEHKNYSILLLGGKQEVGERALKNLKLKFPNLKLDYLNGGDFNSLGNSISPNLISQINSINLINPTIIFVCLGAPKQEYFMSANQDKLNAKLMLGLGGTIDFLAGQVSRAPESFQKLGLEWLWRGFKEPWRWKRIFNAVIIFPLVCLYWKFGNLFFYRGNVVGFIINQNKQIFIARHTGDKTWKLPQGGSKNAKSREDLETAILREMKEELGTDKFEILKMLKKCYKYKWPANSLKFDKYRGQKQTLFLLKFLGQDSDIILDKQEHTEWQWIDKNDILEKADPIRRSIIKIGLKNFKNYL